MDIIWMLPIILIPSCCKFSLISCQNWSNGGRSSGPPPDTTPPSLICPPDMIVANDPMQKYAWVTWQDPVATDKGASITPRRSGRSPGWFPEGSTEIFYSAMDNAGNIATCSFTITVNVIRCVKPTSIARGYYSCTPSGAEHRYGSYCRYGCYRGYRLSGTRTVVCYNQSDPTIVDGVWSSSAPSCSVMECSAEGMVPPANGGVSCTDANKYQSKCSFSCNTGFAVPTGQSRVKVCNYLGQWVGNTPSCIDKEKPKLVNCPVDRIAYTEKGSETAEVTWSPPSVTDNLDLDLSASLLAGNDTGSRFSVGSHVIRYGVTDSAGNEAIECTFTIYVRRLSCHPIYPTSDVLVTCSSGYGFGAKCQFQCRAGASLNGVSETECDSNRYPPLPLWDYGSFHQQPTCESVKCAPLDPPANGALACDLWMYGEFCQMMCNDQYDIPRTAKSRNFKMSVCQSSGSWSVSSFSDCEMPGRPDRIQQQYKYYYFSGDCCDLSVQNTIRQNFINTLSSSSFSSVCSSSCTVDNVEVRCHGGCDSRKKRSEFVTEVRVTASTETLDNLQGEAAYNAGKDTLDGVKQTITQTLSEPSVIAFPLVGLENVVAGSVEIVCQDGQVPVYGAHGCMGCSRGYYLDSSTGECEPCAVGWYQDSPHSNNCTSCPVGQTTRETGSKSIDQCFALCDAGQFSSDGLPPCSPCPAGTYSPSFGATSCQSCPAGKWTELEGSNSQNKCQSFDLMFSPSERLGSLQLFKMIDHAVGEIDLAFKFQTFDAFEESQAPLIDLAIRSNDASLASVTVQVSPTTIVIQADGCSLESDLPVKTTQWYSFTVKFNSGGLTLTRLSAEQTASGCSWSALPPGSYNISLLIGSKTDKSPVEKVTDVYVLTDAAAMTDDQAAELTTTCAIVPADSTVSWDELPSSPLIENAVLSFPSKCDDTNNCENFPCGSHQCLDELNGYLCVCDEGYTGVHCENNIDDCESHVCAERSTCIDDIASYACACSESQTGDFCETEIVSGSWSEWTQWGLCSKSCGHGVETRERSCSNPPPGPAGQPCHGEDTQSQSCIQESCPVCTSLKSPLNGRVNCRTEEGHRICSVTCDPGYEHPVPPPPDGHRCGPDTFFQWTPLQGPDNPSASLPDCTATATPEEMVARQVLSYPDMPCEEKTLESARQTVEYNLAKLECIKDRGCFTGEPVLTGCDAAAAKRRKRSAGVVIEFKIWVINPIDQRNITVLDDETTSALNKTASPLVSAVAKIQSDLADLLYTVYVETLSGHSMYYVGGRAIDGLATCPPGQTYYNFICVFCGRGTYEKDDYCWTCPTGSYQGNHGSVTCDLCPTNLTTTYSGSYYVDSCHKPCGANCERRKGELFLSGPDDLPKNETLGDPDSAHKSKSQEALEIGLGIGIPIGVSVITVCILLLGIYLHKRATRVGRKGEKSRRKIYARENMTLYLNREKTDMGGRWATPRHSSLASIPRAETPPDIANGKPAITTKYNSYESKYFNPSQLEPEKHAGLVFLNPKDLDKTN